MPPTDSAWFLAIRPQRCGLCCGEPGLFFAGYCRPDRWLTNPPSAGKLVQIEYAINAALNSDGGTNIERGSGPLMPREVGRCCTALMAYSI